MNEEERQKLLKNAVEELKHEYLMVHKDQWRAYLVRTFSAILLVGGVTMAGVFWVVWSSATAATNRRIVKLESEAKHSVSTIKEILSKAKFQPGEHFLKIGTVQICWGESNDSGNEGAIKFPEKFKQPPIVIATTTDAYGNKENTPPSSIVTARINTQGFKYSLGGLAGHLGKVSYIAIGEPQE